MLLTQRILTWCPQPYPLIPGHEIVGRVLDVGPDVKKFKKGENVAVGCMVDSCQQCDQCSHGEEQYCRAGMTATYGSPDRISGEVTQWHILTLHSSYRG